MTSSTFAELEPPEIKTVLKERFPGWSIVHSNVDRWWAFQHRESPATGLRVDLDADTPEQLANKLDKINDFALSVPEVRLQEASARQPLQTSGSEERAQRQLGEE